MTDRLELHCPQCGRSMRVKVELAGKVVKCRGCGSKVRIPIVASTASSEEPDDEQPGWLGVRKLTTNLRSGKPAQRREAAARLAELDDADVIKPMLAALDDRDLEVRRTVARGLHQRGWADDPSKRVRLAVAARQSEAIDPLGPEAVEPLIVFLASADEDERLWTLSALGHIGDPQAVETLVAALADSATIGVAAEALGRIGDALALDPLLAAIEAETGRGQVARALGKLADRRAVPALIPLLVDGDATIRASAAVALGEIGDDRAAQPLIAAMERPHTRVEAARGLHRLRDRDAQKAYGSFRSRLAATIAAFRKSIRETTDPSASRDAREPLKVPSAQTCRDAMPQHYMPLISHTHFH